ncbi:MAG: class C sortase [Clostridium sp.]|jgi:sortase A|nr:class C sortase [Clostridium sp.]
MRKRTVVFAIIFVLIGVGIFAYPWVSSWWNSYQSRELLERYEQAAAKLTKEETDEQFMLAQAYNNKVSGLAPYDPFSQKEPVPFPEYGEILTAGNDGVMAALELPSIGTSLPVYHGVSDDVLQRGIGHMPTTALPVGGEGTHCVLTGHNGIPSHELFTHLDKLKLGDAIIIHVLGEKIGYRVDQILVVTPTETEPLKPIAGGDYITLITCTPYGINSHRLYVRGVRDDSVISSAVTQSSPVANNTLLYAAIITSAFMALLVLVVWLIKRRRNEKGN